MLRILCTVALATLFLVGSFGLLTALSEEPGGSQVVARGPAGICQDAMR